ncbi:unnamed protein product [Dimorphilus gyrociliatus]|uniref:Uncharacterized protein n=1 Tax=Dimorphilus gyrociliatus TaxID=2664684 RepID=A0A7I8V8Z7_9ANNE|nr:unnamed protein product [Dimorphilus gyrociliatus]
MFTKRSNRHEIVMKSRIDNTPPRINGKALDFVDKARFRRETMKQLEEENRKLLEKVAKILASTKQYDLRGNEAERRKREKRQEQRRLEKIAEEKRIEKDNLKLSKRLSKVS